MKRILPVLFFACCISTAPVSCADEMTKSALAEADKYALQEKYISEAKASKAHSLEVVKQINGIVDRLKQPSQLVDLISLCKEKISQMPSDSTHEPYFSYFEFVQEFAISKLGQMHTPEAKIAFNQVRSIINGKASLLECWDAAKSEQDNTHSTANLNPTRSRPRPHHF